MFTDACYMTFEESIAKLNKAFLFKEFTFSSNTFKPTPQEELELADSLIWLDDLLITFQVKERGKAGDSTFRLPII